MAETEIGINQFMAEAEIGIRHHDKSSKRVRPQHLLYDMEQAKTRWRLRSNTTIDSKRVKEILSALGADLCGGGRNTALLAAWTITSDGALTHSAPILDLSLKHLKSI